MPNNLVFNGLASQLQTLINGVDSNGVSRKVLTDTLGRLVLSTVTVDTRPLSAATDSVTVFGTVTVSAENFDIRDLSGATDSVTVFGTITVSAENFDIRNLSGATDSIQLSSRLFTQSFTSLVDVTDSAAILIEDTSENSMYSFYVFNTGTNTLTAVLQISPTVTSTFFMDDGDGPVAISPGGKTTLVNAKYLHYTQLFYETGGAACSFTAYYNAQV